MGGIGDPEGARSLQMLRNAKFLFWAMGGVEEPQADNRIKSERSLWPQEEKSWRAGLGDKK